MGRKTKDFDVESIATLDAFYAFLDANSMVLDREHELLDMLVKFRDKELETFEKQEMQWEVETFFFTITGNRVFSFSYSTGLATGEIKEFPVLDDFQAGG